MEFIQAVKAMSEYNVSDAAIRAIYDEVEPLCKTTTDGNDGQETTLWDWLSETGGYTGNETPDGIAQEWDDLSTEA